MLQHSVLRPGQLNNAAVAPAAGPILANWAGQGQGVSTNSLCFVVIIGVFSGVAVTHGSGLIWETAASRDIL